jgi:carotenoid cleavage dioxygenase-like enzyme
VWHFANAFTDGTSIGVDFCRWAQPGLGAGGGPARGATQRARLDVAAGTVGFDTFDDTVAELPRLDDRLLGRRHRFFDTASRDPDHTGGARRVERVVGEHGVAEARVPFGLHDAFIPT